MFSFLSTQPLPLLTYLILTTLFLFTFFSNWGNDDPYITYRYAENLYAGRGFVYNAGEPILSTTSPLFALLLAGIRFFTSNLPRAANLIGAISLTIGALFLWDIARQWKTPFAGWASLALYPTFELLVRTLGSETPLYLALCLSAVAFYLRQRYTLAAMLLALAMLMRGDAAVLAVVLTVDWLFKNVPRPWKGSQTFLQNLPWKALLAGGTILFGWCLFALPYFGSPFPTTLAAKRAQGVMQISEKFAPGFLTVFLPYFQTPHFGVETILIIVGFIASFWRRSWLLWVSWGVFYFLAYFLLGVPRYFWYYAPLVPVAVGWIGLGLEEMQRFLVRYRLGGRLSIGITTLFLVGLAIAQGVRLWQSSQFPDERLSAYRIVGTWLAQNTLPKARIGVLEVGVIGYYAAPRPMVDFAGLIQPDVTQLFAPNTTYEHAALWAIAQYQPNVIVLHDGWFPAVDHFAAESCRPAKRFPGMETGYSFDLSIYRCQYP
ncbi:MAG: hypothetical protein Fur0022_14650 [Anaerolineales bacterium]